MIREAIEIAEKYIENSSAMKEWELASKAYLPLTPSIMKELEFDVKDAYHATDMDGLKTIKRYQKSKKTISAFTKGSVGISQGARVQTEVVVRLDGKGLFQAEGDFYSSLSRNGYKWLSPLMTEKDYVVNNEFSVPMFKKMVEYFGVKDRHAIPSTVKGLSGKDKAKFIKWYMDEAKKLISKKLLKSIQKSISKSIHSTFNNDEVLLHSYEVKGVSVVEYQDLDLRYSDREITWSENKKAVEKMGFKFDGFIKPEDIAKIGR